MQLALSPSLSSLYVKQLATCIQPNKWVSSLSHIMFMLANFLSLNNRYGSQEHCCNLKIRSYYSHHRVTKINFFWSCYGGNYVTFLKITRQWLLLSWDNWLINQTGLIRLCNRRTHCAYAAFAFVDLTSSALPGMPVRQQTQQLRLPGILGSILTLSWAFGHDRKNAIARTRDQNVFLP